jgi:hypothetical protein
VLCAVMGQKKKGIIVGLKQRQLHAIPRYRFMLYQGIVSCRPKVGIVSCHP